MLSDRILCAIVTLICFLSCAQGNNLFAAQDDMAVGKFIGGKSNFQLVLFHFERGKTHLKFFEKLSGSAYLFPVYDLLIQGQLRDTPVICDVNNDGLDDIRFETTADKGIVYFSAEQEKLVKAKEVITKQPTITKEDELKLIEDIE